MRYRALDANGDSTFCSGATAFLVDSPETVAQAILTRFRLVQGKWFLNNLEGMPYMTQVLQNNTQMTRDIAMKSRVLDTPGVISIESYSSRYDSQARSFRVSMTVNTEYGTATVTT